MKIPESRNEPVNWTCPYCHHDTTLTIDTNLSFGLHTFDNDNSIEKNLGIQTVLIICPNPLCQEYTIEASLYRTDPRVYPRPILKNELLFSWKLKPSSTAIPQPDYIPLSIRQDYEEACAIIDLSPKASATLSRRCLQGMIRDFWGIRKSKLFEEIQSLKDIVDNATWEAIDAIRQIGNIGAHMEKDVNIIVDIEPIEAQLLIQLIEDLFQTWYVTRHEREERSKQIQALAQSKKS